MIKLLNCDCMEYMATQPDNAFDLACCDPPFGIGMDGQKKSTSSHNGRKAYEFKGWDKRPPPEYFKELFRVSRNQIIWGGNYFPEYLFSSMGWIFWDKKQRICNSDGELAFTSFKRALRVVEYGREELSIEGTIHNCQKPVKLYDWIFANYAKPGQRILDTHGGSFSSAIAAHYAGLDFVGCELDKDYYKAACERFKKMTAQLTLDF